MNNAMFFTQFMVFKKVKLKTNRKVSWMDVFEPTKHQSKQRFSVYNTETNFSLLPFDDFD